MNDILGKEIKVGSTVAVAMGERNSMRVGEVKEIFEDERRLVIDWTHGWFLPSKPGTIDFQINRIVVLDNAG